MRAKEENSSTYPAQVADLTDDSRGQPLEGAASDCDFLAVAALEAARRRAG
jgi:hypothetical protein